ncbi:hypothetical protein DMENIID0001_067340 [Sergentomyia squamirostris]
MGKTTKISKSVVCFGIKTDIPCQWCPKVFRTKYNLRQHVKNMHTGEFPCSICGIILAGKYNFNVHMKSHQQADLWQCYLCPERFGMKISLLNHLAAIHPDSRVATSPKAETAETPQPNIES